VAALLFVCVVLVYLPGIVRVFDFHDSFQFFSYDDHLNCAAHPQAAYLVFTGRPLFPLVTCGVALLMNTVSDAQTVRLLELAILSASGALIVGALRSYGVHMLVAGGTVVGLLSVPGWQLVLSMSQAAAVVFSLPPVLGAFLLIRRIVESGTPIDARVLRSFAGAVALLLIGSLTYQQSSSILFALCAIPVVVSPLARARRMLMLAVAAYAISGALYLVIHRLLVLPLLLPAFGATIDRFAGMAAVVKDHVASDASPLPLLSFTRGSVDPPRTVIV